MDQASRAFGRFLQPDPSDQVQNLYTYVANNPITAVDPSDCAGGVVSAHVDAGLVVEDPLLVLFCSQGRSS